jgi:putative flippase GtrA
MGARLRRLGEEAAKFSAVNVVATAVALLLFNLLAHGIPGIHTPGPLNGWPLTAWFLANCVGMAISFYGSRSYAFKHRRPSGPGGGALIYVVINLVFFVIPMACLWITRNVLGWDSVIADNVSANLVGATLAMLGRFWAFRRFVFKRQGGGVLFGPHGEHESAGAPELSPHETELLEHQSQQRQADPDDVVRVSRHTGDEGTAEPVESEGSGHP